MITREEERRAKSERRVRIDEGRWTKKIFFPFAVSRLSSIVCRLSIVFCLLVSTAGCEAFARKFVRKPKKELLPQEEMVLVPVEYKAPAVDKEALYREYFLYWKSWHDELINSLFSGSNRRKQLECVIETIKNLEQMKMLLKEEKQRQLSVYIVRMNGLKGSIEKDAYGILIESHRKTAERIQREIIKKFSYSKIKSLVESSK